MPEKRSQFDAATPVEAAADCWFLTGATAAGKSSVGLQLADLLKAEIISLDSMAVYRGMNIGTAKPTPRQRSTIPHHLIDIVDPDQQYSVSQYCQAAAEKIGQIRSRGREVLLVGGTPLYLKALLRGIFEGPPADWEFRRQIEDEVEKVGTQALHQRLQQVDPLSAAKLHPNDKRRMIRALEVYRATGQPISHLQTQFDEGRPSPQRKVFVLSWPRAALHRRIDQRIDRMFDQGLVEEVSGLLSRFGRLSRTASQAVGYQEVSEHLAGRHDLAETIELVKTRTHQFARRQETWFRGLAECRFVTQQQYNTPQAVAAEILAQRDRELL